MQEQRRGGNWPQIARRGHRNREEAAIRPKTVAASKRTMEIKSGPGVERRLPAGDAVGSASGQRPHAFVATPRGTPSCLAATIEELQAAWLLWLLWLLPSPAASAPVPRPCLTLCVDDICSRDMFANKSEQLAHVQQCH